jgi:hypothetical protein
VTALRCLLIPLALSLSAGFTAAPDLAAYPWVYLRGGLLPGAGEELAEAIVVGDILLGRGVSVADDPLADVSPWLRAADLAVGNLEGVIVASDADCSRSAHANGFQLLMPPSAAVALSQAGFDLVGIANNHALDCGAEGLANELSFLREVSIETVGAVAIHDSAVQPVLRNVRGVRLAWLAFNMVPYPAGFGSLATDVGVPYERAVAAVQAARATADAVIVLVHWGYEYEHRPDPAQQAAAQALLAAGADLVVGHHPHVAQSVTTSVADATTGAVVAYSLGNFVFDQQFDSTRVGLALRAFFDRDGLRAVQALPIHAGPRPRLVSPDAATDLLARLALPPPDDRRLAFACGPMTAALPDPLSAASDYCQPVTAGGAQPLPGGVFTQDAVDLTGDGVAEVVQRRDNQVSVQTTGAGGAVVWQSDPDWRVVDVAVGDPNDDGRSELLLALWKPGADGVPRSHPFVIGYRGGLYRTLWGGSAVNRPLREVELADVDGDMVQELIVLEEGSDGQHTLAVWRWHGWGFSLLWRSQPGPYADLGLATLPGTDAILLTVEGGPASGASTPGELRP